MLPSGFGQTGEYVLATGADAVGRLNVLHRIYSPKGREALLNAGISEATKVADFGCGPGFTSRWLSELVDPSGTVVGIDLHRAQIEEAAQLSAGKQATNVQFVAADACNTGFPDEQFDFVYCRFLLLHLADPAACVREMWRVLKPGGTLVAEDGDLASACSVPPTALDAFGRLFTRLGAIRGVDYSLANRLWHLVADAGFRITDVNVHQPSDKAGLTGLLLKWSVEEAGPSFVNAGLLSSEQFRRTVNEMDRSAKDPEVLALAPRMVVVTAQKRVN